MEKCACPGCGSCSGMFTANSMNCLSETVGLALPGNGTIPAHSAERIPPCKVRGMAVMNLLKKTSARATSSPRTVWPTPSPWTWPWAAPPTRCSTCPPFFTRQSSTSPWTFRHHQPQDAEPLSPLPRGPHILRNCMQPAAFPRSCPNWTQGLLRTDVITATGKTLGENLKALKAKNRNPEVIHNIDNPYSKEGGIAILRGNLAPDGAVVKQSAVAPEMMQRTGVARVFDGEEEANQAILDDKIKPGDVIVIRYEGPRGGPGMREMLSPTANISGMGLDTKSPLSPTAVSPAARAARHRPRVARSGLRRHHRPGTGRRQNQIDILPASWNSLWTKPNSNAVAPRTRPRPRKSNPFPAPLHAHGHVGRPGSGSGRLIQPVKTVRHPSGLSDRSHLL